MNSKLCAVCQEQPKSKSYFNCKTCSDISCIEEFKKQAYQKQNAKVLNPIIPKDKNCKGTTDNTKGFGCGKPSKNRKFGLGIGSCDCYKNWLLNSDQGKEHLKRVTISSSDKVQKAKKTENLIKDRNTRIELMTLSDFEKEAKKVFQRFIRIRDKDFPCISCNNSKTNDWSGGHFFSAGMYSGYIFDERNCHKQCNTHCNKFLSGNLLEYRKGLILRYGLSFVEELESISDSKRDYKYTKEELLSIKNKYLLKIKEII